MFWMLAFIHLLIHCGSIILFVYSIISLILHCIWDRFNYFLLIKYIKRDYGNLQSFSKEIIKEYKFEHMPEYNDSYKRRFFKFYIIFSKLEFRNHQYNILKNFIRYHEIIILLFIILEISYIL